VRKLLVATACSLVLLGAACSDKGGTRPAATVNGHNISTQALVDELDAIAGNADYLEALKQANQGVKIEGDSEGSFDVTFARSKLRDQIFYAIIHDEVTRQGIKADDACVEAARKEVYASVGFSDTDKGEATFAKFPKGYQDTLLERDVDLLSLQAHLAGQECVAEDAAKAYYDANPGEFEQTCGSVILVADQAAADAASARLKAGEDFAAVAKAVSLDTASAANGGDFGCKTKSELSTAAISVVFTTPVGEVSAATSLGNGGFVIVKVVSRKQAALEDVRQQAAELAASQASNALQAFLQQFASSATITVDARYGTWNAQRGDIDAPEAATQGSTPTTSTESVPASSS
jgi:parvulin-like peptidyl-prolyl isomerase